MSLLGLVNRLVVHRCLCYSIMTITLFRLYLPAVLETTSVHYGNSLRLYDTVSRGGLALTNVPVRDVAVGTFERLIGLDDSSVTLSFDPVGNIQRLLAQQHGTLRSGWCAVALALDRRVEAVVGAEQCVELKTIDGFETADEVSGCKQARGSRTRRRS